MLTSPAFLMGLIMLLREPKQKRLLLPLLQHLCWRNQVSEHMCSLGFLPQACLTASAKPEDVGSKRPGVVDDEGSHFEHPITLFLCAIRSLLLAHLVW